MPTLIATMYEIAIQNILEKFIFVFGVFLLAASDMRKKHFSKLTFWLQQTSWGNNKVYQNAIGWPQQPVTGNLHRK